MMENSLKPKEKWVKPELARIMEATKITESTSTGTGGDFSGYAS